MRLSRLVPEEAPRCSPREALAVFSDLMHLAKPSAFTAFLAPLRRLNWVVDTKRPFAGPEQVLRYFSRYTHRVAISNHRLVDATDDQVTFTWKDYRHEARISRMTLAPDEFIRRFLLHVLPDGFQRIRHYGFLANGHRQTKLARIRQLLPTKAPQKASATDPSGDVTITSKKLQRRLPPTTATPGNRRVPSAVAPWTSSTVYPRRIALADTGSTPHERCLWHSDPSSLVSATPMQSGSPCAKPSFDPSTACRSDCYIACQSLPGFNLPKSLAPSARAYQAAHGAIPIAPRGPRFSSIRFLQDRANPRRQAANLSSATLQKPPTPRGTKIGNGISWNPGGRGRDSIRLRQITC